MVNLFQSRVSDRMRSGGQIRCPFHRGQDVQKPSPDSAACVFARPRIMLVPGLDGRAHGNGRKGSAASRESMPFRPIQPLPFQVPRTAGQGRAHPAIQLRSLGKNFDLRSRRRHRFDIVA